MYERFNEVNNGGFNYIIPNKFIAFANPISKPNQAGLIPEKYAEIFKSLQVTAIIRLNEIAYDRTKFIKRGFHHYELYFHDGSTPSYDIIDKFFEITEREPVIAMHCQAGLGRTATLIGCYAIKNFEFTGNEFIAWARMCRSGSVLGPQQHFLCEYYEVVNGCNEIERPLMTPYEKFKAQHGDLGQGSRLSVQANREVLISIEEPRKTPPVNYRTKYNQITKIDPVLLKLYGNKHK